VNNSLTPISSLASISASLCVAALRARHQQETPGQLPGLLSLVKMAVAEGFEPYPDGW
jgi:hypothetical protein